MHIAWNFNVWKDFKGMYLQIHRGIMSYKASYSDMDQKSEGMAEDNRSRKVRQKRIGDQLRRLYDDVTNEPVPDEFLSLLEQADNSSKNQK